MCVCVNDCGVYGWIGGWVQWGVVIQYIIELFNLVRK